MAINWIRECVELPSFSVLVNGKSCDFFKSNRGLRQGCPLSLYLFCIVMEFFSAVLTDCARSGLILAPYSKRGLEISHLLFADDVMIFARATTTVAGNLKKFLDHLGNHSGLKINGGKSSIFFSNCDTNLKHSISSVQNFQQKNVPMKYLGCPFYPLSLSSRHASQSSNA